MNERENAVTMWEEAHPVPGEVDVPKQVLGPRLTVVQSVYHQRPDMNPTQYENRWDILLTEDDQPYYRERTLPTGERHNIECGWVEHPGVLLIANQEGQFTDRNPTEDEAKEMAGRILILTIGDMFEMVIRPRDCQRICLHSDIPAMASLKLVNDSVSAIRYSITAFSR